MMTTTTDAWRARSAVALALTVAILSSLLGPIRVSAQSGGLEVPVPEAPVSAPPGSTVSLATVDVPQSLQGRDCDFSVTATNAGSENVGNTLVVASGGGTLALSGIEDTAGSTVSGGGRLTLGAVVEVSVVTGPESPGSSVSVDVSCRVPSGPGTGPPPPVKGEVNVRCSPDPVEVDGTWTISGGDADDGPGFQPGADVEVSIGHDEIVNTTADDDGLFSVDYEVDLPPGEWTVLAASLGAIGVTSCTISEPVLIPSIMADPTSGGPGDEITVRGKDYTAGDLVDITLGDETFATDVLVDDDGEFTIAGEVPQLDDGDYDIAAIRGYDPEAEPVDFTINIGPLKPVIKVDPGSGRAGSTATVTGSRYEPGDRVNITLGGETFATDVLVDDDGTFTVEGAVPDLAAGPYDVSAVRGSGLEADSLSFTINIGPLKPEIKVDPGSGAAGSTATVTGSRYEPGDLVNITFDEQPFATDVPVDDDGTFTVEGAVPDLAAGPYDVSAVRGSGLEADSVGFEVTSDCFRILGICWWWWLLIIALLLLLIWLILWLMCRYRYPFEPGQPIKGTTWIAGEGDCKLEDGCCVPDGDGCDDGHSCELFRRKMFRSDGCWERVERKGERFWYCYRCSCARSSEAIIAEAELLDEGDAATTDPDRSN